MLSAEYHASFMPFFKDAHQLGEFSKSVVKPIILCYNGFTFRRCPNRFSASEEI